MWLKWLPWRLAVRHLAKGQGFLDPLEVWARVNRFSQPSEVAAPIELIRAGLVFHARGLINTRAIQHNLDWIWPYWIERQFDPNDDAFIPRAFSFTHVNLTARNWTAVGLPGLRAYPLVDPRGLLTPFFDGWSLDAWIAPERGEWLTPSRLASVEQSYDLRDERLTVGTLAALGGMTLRQEAWVSAEGGAPQCVLQLSAASDVPARLVVSLRPCNPEGISFIHTVELEKFRSGWTVNGRPCVRFDRPAGHNALSTYCNGDVSMGLFERPDEARARCDVGMATAAASFMMPNPGETVALEVRVDLRQDRKTRPLVETRTSTWRDALGGGARLDIPHERHRFLYDAAVRTLLLHSPADAYPGPYTYRRFWFRDAVFMAHGLLLAGFRERARTVIDRFLDRQKRSGYFHSQDGEWDSNGQVLWMMRRFSELTGEELQRSWLKAAARGAKWIGRKRTREAGAAPHAGLLPAGFSAEHLGNNDYYYWDDFWSLAGLRAAEAMFRERAPRIADGARSEADSLDAAIDMSLRRAAYANSNSDVLPASPYRRPDSGSIGSLAAGYPLCLWPKDDPRLLATADFLIAKCFVRGAFFQDMIHSGINPYLTLHVAQVLLRAGDSRAARLIRRVAELASPTGQWPEAIHPRTLGGCMGDGQHAWAAAEWVAAVRNQFLMEEPRGPVLAAGLLDEWLKAGSTASLGPLATRWGEVTVRVEVGDGGASVSWDADWRASPPEVMNVRLPGHHPREVASPGASGEVKLERGGGER